MGYNSKPLGVPDLAESDPAPAEIRRKISMDLNGSVVRPHARREPAGLLLLAVMEKENPACPGMQRCGCKAMS